MMAMSLALVGVANILTWRLVTAKMITIDGSYWELYLLQQISLREMAQLTLHQFGRGKQSKK